MKKSLIILLFAIVTLGFIFGLVSYNKSIAHMVDQEILEEEPFENNPKNDEVESPLNETPGEVTEDENKNLDEEILNEEAKEVPNLYGLTQKEAVALLEKEGWDYKVYLEEKEEVEPDKVFYQRPKPKDKISPNETIHFSVSVHQSKDDEEITMVAMINVVGKYEKEAKASLENLGFRVKTRKNYSSQPKGMVISQSESIETKLEKGSSVTLTISLGEEEKNEPKPEPEPPKPSDEDQGAGNQKPPVQNPETPQEQTPNGPAVSTPSN